MAIAAAAVTAAIVLCIAFVDRPASTWAHEHFHRLRVIQTDNEPTDLITPLAALGVALLGIATLARLRLPGWAATPLECCLAALIGFALKEQFKFAFDRVIPEMPPSLGPSWIGQHVYRFQPFHGGGAWASFPSGHETLITAPCAVLWRRLPRLRWLYFLLCLGMAVALYLPNYHFVSDIIAGAALGTCCGLGVVNGRPARS